MVLKTLSLFSEEEKPVEKTKIRIIRKPLVKKEERSETVYDKEIDQLLNATRNRMFLDELLTKEQKIIFSELSNALTKSGKPLETIVREATILLKESPNLYVIQAIKFATKEWGR